MKQERERVSKRATAEELRCHQTGQHGIVCHMQESYYRADFRTAGRPIRPLSLNDRERERLNRLMTRSLFTIEEDCDRPQTAHLAFTTKQA